MHAIKRKDRLLAAIVDEARQRLESHERLLRRCVRSPRERVLHDFRIETRRLLASVALLVSVLPEPIAADSRKFLKRQLKATSKLRDLQVHRRLITEMADRRPGLRSLALKLRSKEQRAGFKTVKRLARRRDAESRRALTEALAAVAARVERGRKGIAFNPRPTLRHAFKRIQRLGCGGTDDFEQLHRLRVALKNYRYLQEALLAQRASPLLTALRQAQKCLGEVHDLALLEKRLRKFGQRQQEGAGRGSVRAVVRRRQTRVRRQRRLMAAICEPRGREELQLTVNKTQGLRSGARPLALT